MKIYLDDFVATIAGRTEDFVDLLTNEDVDKNDFEQFFKDNLDHHFSWELDEKGHIKLTYEMSCADSLVKNGEVSLVDAARALLLDYGDQNRYEKLLQSLEEDLVTLKSFRQKHIKDLNSIANHR